MITMFIFGALRIIKAGFTQRKVMHHIYQHSSLQTREGGLDILTRSTVDWERRKPPPKRLNILQKGYFNNLLYPPLLKLALAAAADKKLN